MNVKKMVQGGSLRHSTVKRTERYRGFSKGEEKGVATEIGGNPGEYSVPEAK